VPARPQAQAAGQPAPSLPAPAGGPVTFGLGDVLFDTAKSELRPEADATLNSVVAQLAKHPDRHIRVEGHTDNRGGSDYNLGLSQRRAEAVRAYLVAHGIADSRISVRGVGEAGPVASNASAEGRQRNRRVDVTLG
jgi:outer membrane protein OmpA-like peptidoglycan-associated protein